MSWWRAFGPAMARPGGGDVLRGSAGAGLGLVLAATVVYLAEDARLIAPLGASAVMVFALPNSPLAQPWSVVVGNTVATLLGFLLVWGLPAGPWLGPAVVVAALLAMHGLRALHPPGGAMAFLVALGNSGEPAIVLGVAGLGSLTLVATAMLWHRATGRVYPFRYPASAGTHAPTATGQASATRLDPVVLEDILERFRQSANLGVADLARLVGAVDQAGAARRMEGFTCADIMTRDLVTVGPEAQLAEVADHFRRHGFASVPVVDGDGGLLGMIFQIDLIRRAREDAFHSHQSLIGGLSRMIDDHRASPLVAAHIMQHEVPQVTPDTPVGALLPLLSDGGIAAVPVVQGARLVGMVTRTDLVAALAQRLALAGNAA